MKRNDTDELDTDCVDMDQLLGMYCDEFRNHKRSTYKKMQK